MADSSNKEYLSRSWRMVTHDKGWYKPLLVLPVADLVPIAGVLGVQGYRFEWARMSAWGLDTYPKQKDVKIGACIKSGWRVFLSSIGYALVLFLIGLAVGRGTESTLAALIWTYLCCLWSIIMDVAALRATIYQKAGAAYKVNRVVDMLKRDFKSLALLALWLFLGILLIEGFVILMSILVAVPAIYEIMPVLYDGGMGSAYLIVRFFAQFAPWMVLVVYFAGVFYNALALCLTNAIGLWMRQFDVPAWKSPTDPLPDAGPQEKEPERPVAPEASAPSSGPREAPEPGQERPSASAPDEKGETETEEKPVQGLPAIGESSAPEDEPARVLTSDMPAEVSGSWRTQAAAPQAGPQDPGTPSEEQA